MLKVRRARADEFDQVLDFYTNMIDGMRGTCRRSRYASAAFPIDRIQDQLLSVLAGARLLSSAFLRGLRSL